MSNNKNMKRIFLLIFLLIFSSGCAVHETSSNSEISELDEIQNSEIIINESEIPENLEESKEEPRLSEVKTLTIPQEIENACFGFLTGSPYESKLISEIGMGWSRPHIGPFIWNDIESTKNEFDFSETDLWVKKAQENNVATLATIWPYADWDQKECRGAECLVSKQDQFSTLLPRSRCAPCNIEDYENFLVRLVERYDGDGVDDMPGLEIPVKYWEILNEPEMSEPTLTFYIGKQEEYLDILKSSKVTIKSACPDCKIVQGGAAGTMDFMLDYWKNIFNLGAAEYFDIANIHYIGSGELSNLNVKEFKKLMNDNGINKPIWVTEAEYHRESDVQDSIVGAFSAGAEKIFFTRFVVGQTGPPAPGKYSPVYKEIKCDYK